MNAYNKKAIADVYKNAHIALQSLKDLIPTVDDQKIRKELKEQYIGYEKAIDQISGFMLNNKLKPKDINPFKKVAMWTSIKMKTMINNSKNQVAEMMIKGTVMGITELTAMKNESERLNDGVKEQLNNLLSLEKEYEERLKAYL